MKKLFSAIAFVCLLVSASFGQGARYDSNAYSTSGVYVTAVSCAQITVCSNPAT